MPTCIVKKFFLIIQHTHSFPKFILSRKSTCFEQFLCPSSGVFHSSFGIGIHHQICMTYTSAECTVENSWRWAEELPEICRVSWKNKFGKLVRVLVLLKRKFEQTSFFITHIYYWFFPPVSFRGKSSTCSLYEFPPITWPLDVMRVASAVPFCSSADNFKFPVMCRFWDFHTRIFTREQGAEEDIWA
jgi:hypothetical protein